MQPKSEYLEKTFQKFSSRSRADQEGDGLCLKRHAGLADHSIGGCPGQNILEVKNSGH